MLLMHIICFVLYKYYWKSKSLIKIKIAILKIKWFKRFNHYPKRQNRQYKIIYNCTNNEYSRNHKIIHKSASSFLVKRLNKNY